MKIQRGSRRRRSGSWRVFSRVSRTSCVLFSPLASPVGVEFSRMRSAPLLRYRLFSLADALSSPDRQRVRPSIPSSNFISPLPVFDFASSSRLFIPILTAYFAFTATSVSSSRTGPRHPSRTLTRTASRRYESSRRLWLTRQRQGWKWCVFRSFSSRSSLP